MSSIALFPCSFTPSASVSKKVASDLGLTYYNDDSLINDTARKHGASTDKLQQALYGKTSVFNQFTLEREKSLNLLRTELADKLAEEKGYLFYGYMTALIPAKISHTLKVLLVASKKARTEEGVKRGLSEKEAKKAVRNDDVSAYGLTDFLYKKEAYDSSLYDLVVPVELKSEDDLVQTVSQYFHTTSVLYTEKSQKAASEVQLEMKVAQVLLEAGHNVDALIEDGTLLLKVKKSVLNFDKLKDELTEIAMGVEGVEKVTVEKSYEYADSIYRRQKFDLPSKVLFVDDEKEFVQTVSERLISRDVGTYGVFNGEEALSLIEEDRPDVMVLDLKMPGIYGVEVLRKTKEIAPEVEVIILTGHGSSQDMLDCMELGAFAYMNKPVDIEELSATIKAAYKKVADDREAAAKTTDDQ